MVTLSGCLSNFLWALSVFVATVWLQDVKDLSPLESGLAFLAMSAGVAFAGPLSGRLVVHYDVGLLMAVAALLGAAGALGVSLVSELPVWLPLFGILGLGVGINYALVNQGALAAVPPEKAGAASGIALTALVIGAALATVIAATLLEELSDGPVDQSAADQVMRVGAVAGLLAAVPAATAVAAAPARRRARPRGGLGRGLRRGPAPGPAAGHDERQRGRDHGHGEDRHGEAAHALLDVCHASSSAQPSPIRTPFQTALPSVVRTTKDRKRNRARPAGRETALRASGTARATSTVAAPQRSIQASRRSRRSGVAPTRRPWRATSARPPRRAAR